MSHKINKFDDLMEILQEGRYVSRYNVTAALLRRKVWVASNYLPGCMPDSYTIVTTKNVAIEVCAQIADNGDGTPRGLRTGLRRNGWHDVDGYRYKVEQAMIGDLI